MRSIILAGFLFLAIPSFSYATSGACSYHGGVSCSSGADSDGSVICSDGWRDSSVSYSSMNECRVATPQCSYPVQPYCSLNEIEQRKQSALGSIRAIQARSGLLGSSFSESQNAEIENQYSLEYSACQSQLSSYQSQLSQYASCSNQNQVTQTLQNTQTDTQIKVKYDAYCSNREGVGSSWNGTLEPETMCQPTFVNMNKSCVVGHGDNSIYDKDLGYCSCKFGTQYNSNGQCPSEQEYGDKICSRFGSNVHLIPNTKNCTCNTGYTINKTSKLCELKVVEKVPEKISIKKPVEKQVMRASTTVIINATTTQFEDIDLIATSSAQITPRSWVGSFIEGFKGLFGHWFK